MPFLNLRPWEVIISKGSCLSHIYMHVHVHIHVHVKRPQAMKYFPQKKQHVCGTSKRDMRVCRTGSVRFSPRAIPAAKQTTMEEVRGGITFDHARDLLRPSLNLFRTRRW